MLKRVILLMLTGCLILAGCRSEKENAGTEQETSIMETAENQETAGTSVETAAEQETSSCDSLIEDHLMEGKFSDEEDPELAEYCYHFPTIRGETEDIEKFNRRQQDLMEQAENGEGLPYQAIRYEEYWNGKLLSLVMVTSDRYTDNQEYEVFNYDFELGRAVSRDELLERKGKSREEYRRAMEKAASKRSEQSMLYMIENSEQDSLDVFASCMDLRMQTILDGNLCNDRTELFMGENETLTAIVNIATPAGAGWYPVYLTPDFTENHVAKKTECDFITAELKDNQVTVSFANTEDAGSFFRGYCPAFHYAYPVRGLYGNYTDMAVSFVGNDGSAYLFLLDDMGLVSCCNLFECMICCSGGLILSDPIPLSGKVKSFETYSDVDGHGVEAVLQDGTREDLYDYISQVECMIDWPVNGSSWDNYGGKAGFATEKDTGKIYWHTAGDTVGEGELFYLGTTDCGLCYGFHISTDSGTASGHLTLGYDFTPGYSGYSLLLNLGHGTPLPGMEHIETESLYPVWP